MARQSYVTPIYDIAEQFRDRCLADDRSLLWPDHHAWTIENLDDLWTAFIGSPDESSSSFFDKFARQLANESHDVHRVATDLMAIYYLFPTNIGQEVKRSGVRQVANWKLAGEINPELFRDVDVAFGVPGLGHAGIYYLTGRPWQIAYYLEFARRLKKAGISPWDRDACTVLADAVQAEVAGSQGARNILLAILFPDDFEPIASNDHKKRIVRAFQDLTDGAEHRDEAIRNIREHLEAEGGKEIGGFYDPQIYSRWNSENEAIPDSPNSEVRVPVIKESFAEYGEDREKSLQELTFLDVSEIQELESILRDKRQLIFEGPPGSGKTYVANRFARWFVDSPLGSMPSNQVEIVQFHQSYGYEDFVQGIRPETDESGHLVYRVRDGIFKQLCERAASNPDLRFVLIIDEINRGNISRIFGELLLLLEYRDERVRLPYAPPDAGDDGYLTIPSNLYVIGTMNSTDRSLAQIDYALRRRFYFWHFAPVYDDRAPILERWLESKTISAEDRYRVLNVFLSINRVVSEQISPDFQVGHSYFMVEDIGTQQGLDRVMRHAIQPLLDEYLHGRRDREEILSAVNQEIASVGTLQDAE